MYRTIYHLSYSISNFTLTCLWLLSGCSRQSTSPQTFHNCKELAEYVGSLKSKASPTPVSMADSGTSTSDNMNLQEKGVDEADAYRAGKNHFFVARGSAVEVVDRSNLNYLGTLPMPGISRLMVAENKLITISEKSDGVEVRTYSTSEHALPVLEHQASLSQKYTDSRLIGENLYLILSGDASSVSPSASTVQGVACSCVSRPFLDSTDTSLTTVARLDINNVSVSPSISSLLGGTNITYMTTKNLYLVHSLYGESQLAFLPLENSSPIRVTSTGKIKGTIYGQWALKELESSGALAITSTLYAQGESNQITIVKPDGAELQVVGKTAPFGNNENVRSVRYVDKLAYVVTFKKTDPLFAFDLTDPSDPKMLGELTLPGFSAYLHPLRNKQLLGLGFDAKDMGNFAWFGGLKLSVFQSSSPKELQELDTKIMGVRGSYSEATYNHHAFYLDEEKNRMGIPVVLLDKKGEEDWAYGTEISYTGAVFYRLDHNQKLQEEARVSHQGLIPNECKQLMLRGSWWASHSISYDVSRIMKLDGRLYTLSPFAITEQSNDAPATTVGSVQFPKMDTNLLCPNQVVY